MAIFATVDGMPYPKPTVTQFDELGVEDGDSLTMTLTPGNPQVKRMWKGKASEYQNALTLMVGDVKLPAVLNGYLQRWNPLRDPTFQTIEAKFDGAANLDHRYYCTSVTNIKPVKWLSEVEDDHPDPAPVFPVVKTDISNQWQYFYYTAQYEKLLYPLLEDSDASTTWTWEYERNVYEQEVRLSADYISLPGGIMRYRTDTGVAPDNRAIPFNVGRVFPTLEFGVVWSRVPDDWYKPGTRLWERLYGTDRFVGTLEYKNQSYVGTVNSKEFFGRPPGTLLLSGVETERRISPLGRIEWNITLKLAYDPNGWNWKYFFSSHTVEGPNGFYLVLKNGATYPAIPEDENIVDGTSLYNMNDFREIFWVADETITPFPP